MLVLSNNSDVGSLEHGVVTVTNVTVRVGDATDATRRATKAREDDQLKTTVHIITLINSAPWSQKWLIYATNATYFGERYIDLTMRFRAN